MEKNYYFTAEDLDKYYKIWVDASTENNGKKSCISYAAMITEENDWIRCTAQNNGQMSSNVGELYAIYMALRFVYHHRNILKRVKIHSDSQVATRWINSKKDIKATHAQKLVNKCRALIKALKTEHTKVVLIKIGRESNKLADLISKNKIPQNLIMDEVIFDKLEPFYNC